jgi:hypothetical protein
MHQCPKFIFVIKPYMFRASSVPIIRGCQLYTQKHVGFYDKHKFWTLMHLVGYFYETYHGARSLERKLFHLVSTRSTHSVLTK